MLKMRNQEIKRQCNCGTDGVNRERCKVWKKQRLLNFKNIFDYF